MRFVSVIYSILFFATTVRAQMTCASRPISPASVRSEGFTELLGDLTIICTGGVPTASGVLVPAGDVTVTLNVPVTNRKNSTDNFIDALLLVDEPHSKANPNIPLTLCGASGVDCNISGTGTGAGVYNGASNRPNVFQGELIGTNTVRFRMPIDAGLRILRIVNLRGDATRTAGQVPNTITATATIPGGTAVSETIVGIVHPGVVPVSLSPGLEQGIPRRFQLPTCIPQNTSWAQSPEGDMPPKPNEFTQILLQEGSIAAWRPRNIAQQLTAGRAGGQVSNTLADLNQNMSGFHYGTESGFFNGASSDPGVPLPALPATTKFPALRGVDRAGAADFGTRISIRFSNVPPEVDFYLPVETPLLVNFSRTGSAVMVQSDSQGGMKRVTGGARYGLAKMTRSGDTATAIYEVVSSDSDLIESLMIPIVIVYSQTMGGAGPVRMTASIAPSGGATGPDSTSVIPRFSGAEVTQYILEFSGSSCGVKVDLNGHFESGGLNGSTAGSIRVKLFNGGTESSQGEVRVQVALPPSLTATSISVPGWTGWTCTLSNLTCSTTQPLPPGQNVANVSVQFNAAPNAPDTVSVSAAISGGGDAVTSNNSFADDVAIRTITKSPFAIRTQPSGLLFTIDGIYYQGTQYFVKKEGQVLQVAAASNQMTSAELPAAFNSWSDGGAISHSFAVPSPSFTTELTARFQTSPSAMTCLPPNVPPLVRLEGLTERVYDYLIRCTGGTPTAIGREVPRVDIRMSLNVPGNQSHREPWLHGSTAAGRRAALFRASQCSAASLRCSRIERRRIRPMRYLRCGIPDLRRNTWTSECFSRQIRRRQHDHLEGGSGRPAGCWGRAYFPDRQSAHERQRPTCYPFSVSRSNIDFREIRIRSAASRRGGAGQPE